MVDNRIVLLTPTAAQEEEMWEKSQDHIKEDEKVIEAWKGEGDGILAFVSLNLLVCLFTISMRSFKTGLLSATIGAFIIEFYKKLSPDSGGQTVDLLGQISQQLTNTRNGTSITAANDQNQSFSPSVYMILVNAMWLISLVFSLTSALITSLNQQAARRYIEMGNVNKQKIDNARVSSVLFWGIQKYKMPLAIFVAPTFLHLSILLFFGGLVIVFHTIYEKVAIAVDAAVGISALVYLAMSLLPFLSCNCPYRTPVTNLLWYLWHAFLFLVAYFGLLLLTKRLPGCSCLCPRTCTCPDSDSLSKPESLDKLDSLNGASLEKPDISEGAESGTQYIRPSLSNLLEEVVKKHGKYLKDGFSKSVINCVSNSQKDEVRKTITWMFTRLSLGDKNKFLEFAASIPRHKVLVLIPPIKSGKIVLRQPLLTLLRSCTDDAGTVGPNEDRDVRKRALMTCLTAINCIAKARKIPDLNFVRGEFAKVSRMQPLWSHHDSSIRITSLSICALVTRQVLRKSHIEEEDQSWLQEVIGEPPNDLEADRMNFKFFVYGALPTGNDHANRLSPDDDISFKETLAILLDVEDKGIDFTTPDWIIWLYEEVRQIQHFDREVFDRLYPRFPSLSSAPPVNIAPPSTYSGAPSNPIYTGPEGRYTSSTQAPSIYREPPSMPVEDPILRYTAPSQASYREGPSSPLEHYSPAPAPRPRRASRSSQVTRPPVIPPPRAVSPHHAVLPPQVPPSPRINFSTRAPSYHAVPPPLATSPSSLISTPRRAVPHPPVVPSASTSRQHHAASSPQVTRPPHVATFSQTGQISRVPSPAHAVSSAPGLPPPSWAVPPPSAPYSAHQHPVLSAPSPSPPEGVPPPRTPPSPHEPPDSFAPGSFRPTREPFPPGHYEPPVPHALGSSHPQRPRRPPQTASSAPGAIPPPRAVFAPSSAPPPRAGPSSSAVLPSVPPTPRTASPSRITHRFHTARPPHAPI